MSKNIVKFIIKVCAMNKNKLLYVVKIFLKNWDVLTNVIYFSERFKLCLTGAYQKM